MDNRERTVDSGVKRVPLQHVVLAGTFRFGRVTLPVLPPVTGEA